MSESLQPHGLQHARPPCPSLKPGICSTSIESMMPSKILEETDLFLVLGAATVSYLCSRVHAHI